MPLETQRPSGVAIPDEGDYLHIRNYQAYRGSQPT